MKALILLHDFGDIINMLSDSEAGQIIKAVFDYEINLKEPEFSDRTMKVVFFEIKRFLDTNRENYEKICRSRSESAKKRWEKYSSDNDDTNICNCIQKDAFTGKAKTKDITKAKTEVKVKDKDNVKANTEQTVLQNESDIHTDKKAYGLFKNVYLTDEEYNLVKTTLTEGERRLDSFSAYMKSSGKSYNDHYARLINWSCYNNNFNGDAAPVSKPKQPGERREPTFDVSEFTKKAINLKYVPPEE